MKNENSLNDTVRVSLSRGDCEKVMASLDEAGEEELADIFSKKFMGCKKY